MRAGIGYMGETGIIAPIPNMVDGSLAHIGGGVLHLDEQGHTAIAVGDFHLGRLGMHCAQTAKG